MRRLLSAVIYLIGWIAIWLFLSAIVIFGCCGIWDVLRKFNYE